MQANPQYPTDFQRTIPAVTTETAALLLDQIVVELGREKLVVPDDLRGDADYPRQALSERGPQGFWPDVDTVRGKIILVVTGAPCTTAAPLPLRPMLPRCTGCRVWHRRPSVLFRRVPAGMLYRSLADKPTARCAERLA